MRLTDEQIKDILQTVHTICGEGSRVMLYGSRLDEHQKGGDVDLLIWLPSVAAQPDYALRARIKDALEDELYIPVDVLLVHKHTGDNGSGSNTRIPAFARHVMQRGRWLEPVPMGVKNLGQ